MERSEVISKVNRVMIESLEFEEDEIKPEANLFTDLGVDSLNMVDLVIGLQREFGVPLRNEPQIRTLKTIGEFYDFFENLTKQKGL